MKLLLATLLCYFASLPVYGKINVKGNSAPNIVLFFVDDMGYGDLPFFGNPNTYTPHLQHMADNGLVFTNFVSPSPVCVPSRAGVLTGRIQTRSGIYGAGFEPSSIGGLPKNETTIAEGLKEVGYTTGMLGKWHLGVGKNGTHLPIHHGFDYYFGIPYTHDACPCYACFYPDTPCHVDCHDSSEFVGCPIMENDEIIQQPADLTTLSGNLAKAGVKFITEAAETGKPFFLYYAFHHTHMPQFAGKMFRNSSIAGPIGDSVAEIDYGVGSIFEALSDTGNLYNTLVIFTADNGPDYSQGSYGGSAGIFRCGKTQTYEGGFRVPTIFWWPQKIITGHTAKLASTYDILPTLFNIAGAKIPQDRAIDGIDMANILYYGEDSGREFVAYFVENAKKDIGPYAVRWKHYKAHFYTDGGNAPDDYPDYACRKSTGFEQHDPPILYDLWWDPGEATPLDTDEYSWLVTKMTNERDNFMAGLEWGVSQPSLGQDDSLQPCATPGCDSWPSCCQIDKLSDRSWNGKLKWNKL